MRKNLFFLIPIFLVSCESKAGLSHTAMTEASSANSISISRVTAIQNIPIPILLQEKDREAMEKYPQTLHKLEKGEPLSIEDIKKMTKAGLEDSVIIEQINTTHSAFYLNTTDIISLKKSKVSQSVIDYMIQSGNR